MSTIRNHLAKFHQYAAESHNDLAKCFGTLAGLAKASKSKMKPDDEEDQSEGLQTCFDKIADLHTDAASFHKSAMEECTKAEGDELDKIVPLGVSMVAPPRDGVRPVLRAGQREIAAPEVPAQFAKLVSVEE
jgi:hypothetical protein